ncbi:hypothetical protein [Flavobacterium phragmitis]|uniref:Uncharacterized protein n=1 Tax=Flavobacterium phragmitis TaxID=739143 RepID=A0A1I1PMV3_9FLAO|nr:hypothetical protein [Flavobacterium phragmitis]SFD11007.1 hypothetical protein SAMN05216297_104256 [Flavobacterium phragmitis]
MKKLKYNIISQKFIAADKDIPFIRTNSKSSKEYNVFIEVFDTDYIKSFFKTFDVSNLYAILILDLEHIFTDANLSFVSKFKIYDKNIAIVKVESDFFATLNYNNRNELEKPFFFRSNNLEELNLDKTLSKSLYQREIILGNFKKQVLTIDALKLVANKQIDTVVEFYINRTEAFLEDILKLKPNVLDVNEDYISKIEISLR